MSLFTLICDDKWNNFSCLCLSIFSSNSGFLISETEVWRLDVEIPLQVDYKTIWSSQTRAGDRKYRYDLPVPVLKEIINELLWKIVHAKNWYSAKNDRLFEICFENVQYLWSKNGKNLCLQFSFLMSVASFLVSGKFHDNAVLRFLFDHSTISFLLSYVSVFTIPFRQIFVSWIYDVRQSRISSIL